MTKPENNNDERNVLDLVAGLKSGAIAGKKLDQETRRAVVEYLAFEGVGTVETSRLVGLSDRTIRRDLEEIRENNALSVDTGFPERIAGELLIETRQSIARIRRAARDKDAPHTARIDGEKAVVEIFGAMISKLQSLGYLPMASQRISADVKHQFEPQLGFDEIRDEIERLKGISGSESTGLDELKRLTDHASEQHEPQPDGAGDDGEEWGATREHTG